MIKWGESDRTDPEKYRDALMEWQQQFREDLRLCGFDHSELRIVEYGQSLAVWGYKGEFSLVPTFNRKYLCYKLRTIFGGYELPEIFLPKSWVKQSEWHTVYHIGYGASLCIGARSD